MKKIILSLVLAIIVIGIGGFLLLQLVPYGRAHTNPPVVSEPQWDSPATRALAQRACFDCHSNETKWPWYTNVAPVSWLTQHDVEEGRSKVNFSEWQGVISGERGEKENPVDELVRVVERGSMPKQIYLPMHPEARLTAAEKQQLIAGFQATFK